MQVYLVRHGQTEWNVQGLLQGASDIALTDEGRRQADSAAHALAQRIGDEPTIISSPLTRAQHTAHALGDLIGAEVHVDDRLRERAYGVWEGITPEERASQWPEQLATWHAHGNPDIPGFEVHDLVRARMVECLEEWADAVEPGRTLVAFSHGSSARVGLQGLLHLPLEHRTLGNLGNTAWSRLSRRDRGDWTLERHNVTADLVVPS
ncbi:histidine phosphatase family protein [Demequina flava]|uniref:histidine phosphatase family protein n=1 Tax=Demequina flava TaxID=1095025 RepID=UPI0007847715|nr:histidine phosphatase family protein [Demequina flava]